MGQVTVVQAATADLRTQASNTVQGRGETQIVPWAHKVQGQTLAWLSLPLCRGKANGFSTKWMAETLPWALGRGTNPCILVVPHLVARARLLHHRSAPACVPQNLVELSTRATSCSQPPAWQHSPTGMRQRFGESPWTGAAAAAPGRAPRAPRTAPPEECTAPLAGHKGPFVPDPSVHRCSVISGTTVTDCIPAALPGHLRAGAPGPRLRLPRDKGAGRGLSHLPSQPPPAPSQGLGYHGEDRSLWEPAPFH